MHELLPIADPLAREQDYFFCLLAYYYVPYEAIGGPIYFYFFLLSFYFLIMFLVPFFSLIPALIRFFLTYAMYVVNLSFSQLFVAFIIVSLILVLSKRIPYLYCFDIENLFVAIRHY